MTDSYLQPCNTKNCPMSEVSLADDGKNLMYVIIHVLYIVSAQDEPQMTDEERLAAIAKQYAVLNNRTAGIPYFEIIIV